MRKLSAGLFISLDAAVEAPDEWHFPYFNAELGRPSVLNSVRRTRCCSAAWPDREAEGSEDAEFAKQLGDARKRAQQKQSPTGHS
jgi:hypothetical protein